MAGYVGIIGCTHIGDIYTPMQKDIITKLDQTTYIRSTEPGHELKVRCGEPLFWNATRDGYSNMNVSGKDSFLGVSQHSNNSILGDLSMDAYAMVLHKNLNCQVWILGAFSQGDLLKESATGGWEITTDTNEALVRVVNNYSTNVLYSPMADLRSGCIVEFLK